MVVLQDRGVVVQDGQLTAAVTQEGAVATRVVDIVDYCANQADRLLKYF